MNSLRKQAMTVRLPRKGSALLIILTFVTLLAVLVISLLLTSRYERTASSQAFGKARSEALADYTADLAIGRLREAIDSGRQRNLPAYQTWVSEPGRIHVFSIGGAGEISRTAREMYSALPGPDESANPERYHVDLNKPNLRGMHAITGNQPGTMKVGWVNLLANPDQPASASNPIVGRIAYWVDDESCKVNVNTADGSAKNTPQSYGFGTPSEISLQALPSGSGSSRLSQSQANDIAQFAWDYSFNSLGEIKRVPGLPADFLATNRFNLTTKSRAPEFNLIGEPRIYLFPVSDLASGTLKDYTRSCLTGGYGSTSTDASIMLSSSDIDFVYPTTLQLPRMLVVDSNADGIPDAENLLQFTPAFAGYTVQTTATNYHFAARIARAIKGISSQNQLFAWPAFPNSTPGGFATKYNNRQLDSIALTIIDVASINAALVNSGHQFASITPKGMLSNTLAIGIGRTPKLTEMRFTIDAFRASVTYPDATNTNVTTANVPAIQVDMELEFYLPAGFAGANGSFTDFQIGSEGSHNHHAINQNDHSGQYANNPTDNIKITNQTPMGGWWSDKLLRFVDGNNPANLAGIDLRAHARNRPDPEATKSATHHPYAFGGGGSSYSASAPVAPATQGGNLFSTVLQTFGPRDDDTIWYPGDYHCVRTTNQGATTLYADPNLNSFSLKGGASLWGRNGSGAISWEIVPLDSIRGSVTGESPKNIITELQEAVVPTPADFNIPIASFDNIWHARVADPLVNKFPGDWIVSANPASSAMTMQARRIPGAVYTSGLKPFSGVATDPRPEPVGNPTNIDGDNPETRPSGGGDPISVWLPRQDYAYPKQSRFPSVGALNFLRTGVIPDDLTVPRLQQKGTPWRTINLAASTSPGQTTASGTYPDWAMLDLFTVPFTPQQPYQTATPPSALPPMRILTSGGSTEGKLNLNNPRIPHPFDVSVSGVTQNPPTRTAPLDALFFGIRTSQSYSGIDPIYATVDQAKAAQLRDAVQNYLTANGPFLLPGQLAEVPAINAYTYTGVSPQSQSRNDLMREVVGATTTQSNVFTVWVVAQSIKKKPGNTNYGTFEPGDTITAETRRQYLVERFIETGRDGVPGNVTNGGKDGVIGTFDDPLNTNYHPPFPTYPVPYRWRIVAVSDSAA